MMSNEEHGEEERNEDKREEKNQQANAQEKESAHSEPLPSPNLPVVEATVAKMQMVAEESASAPSVPRPDEPTLIRAAYEHPLAIRITHWVNAVSLFVMITSGLRIFRAFPSFGPKIPEKVLLDIPKSLTLGGWLGGALQWHFTFMWLFAASRVFRVSGNERPLPHHALRSPRYSRSLANGAAPFFLWPKARRARAVQPTAKAGLHIDHRIGLALTAYRDCPV
jgi:hypothetical protein